MGYITGEQVYLQYDTCDLDMSPVLSYVKISRLSETCVNCYYGRNGGPCLSAGKIISISPGIRGLGELFEHRREKGQE